MKKILCPGVFAIGFAALLIWQNQDENETSPTNSLWCWLFVILPTLE
jgi:hypothetical protein